MTPWSLDLCSAAPTPTQLPANTAMPTDVADQHDLGVGRDVLLGRLRCSSPPWVSWCLGTIQDLAGVRSHK